MQRPRRQHLAGPPGGIGRSEHRSHSGREADQQEVAGLGIGREGLEVGAPQEGEGKELLRQGQEGAGVFRKAVAEGRAEGAPG